MNASNILPVMFVCSSSSSGTALRGAEAQLRSRHTETQKICSFFIASIISEIQNTDISNK